jgi:adenine-specific DNA methylase
LTDRKRLIEVAFPLKQASIDSVHEKNVRHGHISTLHIWPARRPLAACRAALITTLLPDPGDPEERQRILEKLAGKVVQRLKKKKGADGRVVEEMVEETEGGILHWGRENGPDLEWFRQKIREAYGGRAPKVLDPFAGGGAIPLEAMRLGCEATASDINPVAWFILKCTLEYPQKLAGQKRPLPNFVNQDREFMEAYLKAQGYKGSSLQTQLEKLNFQKTNAPEMPGLESTSIDLTADLAWHVRAWGRWVLKQARRDLACYYPTYADFEPLVEVTGKLEKRPMQLVPLNKDGEADIAALNTEFDEAYLKDPHNPRWIAKPTVAYLWARTVTCKNCRANIPLLKTRWLCKKEKKRVILTMGPNAEKTGVVFGIHKNVTPYSGSSAQRKSHDKEIGGGTMSRSGATCPCCGAIMTTEDIRLEGRAGHLGSLITAVILDGLKGKEYRLPTAHEIDMAQKASNVLESIYADIPFGLPDEPLASKEALGFRVPLYGIDQWRKIFISRQLLSLGIFIRCSRLANQNLFSCYSSEWAESISVYLAAGNDRLASYSSTLCLWVTGEFIGQTFTRFALPITWDFAEVNPLSNTTGNYQGAIDWISLVIDHILVANKNTPEPYITQQSAINQSTSNIDVIITDPPYYDAISYSDLMDFFYIWLRRTLYGINEKFDHSFSQSLSPKWNHEESDGELIDDSSRHQGDHLKSKIAYETGMARAFMACNNSLKPNGRLVIVFANKKPDAWETLVSAIIQAGFIVDGSWPIQTERETRMRAYASSALSSSIWLICKKRSEIVRPGWDTSVLREMRQNIVTRLHNFWDAGIRGPDFVWAATGPALEAYSQYPAVKKANEPNQLMTVSEFLSQVRRMVVDFVVGRVLSEAGEEDVSGLDAVTTYYLLHRHDFKLGDVPAGPCILYAVSCGLSDKDLADRYDILSRKGKPEEDVEEDEMGETDEADGESESGGSVFRLKAWNQRKRPNMGYDPHLDRQPTILHKLPGFDEALVQAIEIPLVDQVHRLMQLWRGGDVTKVDEYLDLRGLRRSQLFHPLLQALIELAAEGSEERAMLESISNHVLGRGQIVQRML